MSFSPQDVSLLLKSVFQNHTVEMSLMARGADAAWGWWVPGGENHVQINNF